jgi:hypothetical protein
VIASTVCTLRVGDPSNDPDCRENLDMWQLHIREEIAASIQKMTDLKGETIAHNECLAFVDVETASGRERSERRRSS